MHNIIWSKRSSDGAFFRNSDFCMGDTSHANMTESRKWTLSPTTYWVRWIYALTLLFEFVLYLFELFAWFWTRNTGVVKTKTSTSTQTIDEDELTSDGTPSLKGLGILQDWYNRPSFHSPDVTGEYESRRHRNQMLLTCAIFEAHLNIMARFALRDRVPRSTAAEIRESARAIRLRASESVKFRYVFEELIRFLQDLEKTPADCLRNFVSALAHDRLRKRNNWVLAFRHTRARSAGVPKSIFEGIMAVSALFHQQRAGFDPYYLAGDWKKQNRGYNGAITMIMIFAFDKLAPSASCPLVECKQSGVERILKLGPDFKFVPYVSYSVSTNPAKIKDVMMWDICRNCCNEFVESTWSPECLERVIWTLRHGMRHVDTDLYNELRAKNGQRNLDLTPFNPLALLTFSISGMIRFCGRNDGSYSMTASPEAVVELHGNLPTPTIQHFLILNLLRSPKKGRFIFCRLPGLDALLKPVRVGDKIKFVRTFRAETFQAELWQSVV